MCTHVQLTCHACTESHGAGDVQAVHILDWETYMTTFTSSPGSRTAACGESSKVWGPRTRRLIKYVWSRMERRRRCEGWYNAQSVPHYHRLPAEVGAGAVWAPVSSRLDLHKYRDRPRDPRLVTAGQNQPALPFPVLDPAIPLPQSSTLALVMLFRFPLLSSVINLFSQNSTGDWNRNITKVFV